MKRRERERGEGERNGRVQNQVEGGVKEKERDDENRSDRRGTRGKERDHVLPQREHMAPKTLSLRGPPNQTRGYVQRFRRIFTRMRIVLCITKVKQSCTITSEPGVIYSPINAFVVQSRSPYVSSESFVKNERVFQPISKKYSLKIIGGRRGVENRINKQDIYVYILVSQTREFLEYKILIYLNCFQYNMSNFCINVHRFHDV